MASVEILFEEASESDGAAFLDFMQQIRTETDFLVMDEGDMTIGLDQLAEMFHHHRTSLDQLILLAKIGNQVIGLVSVKTGQPYPISHIGNVFIAVRKAYWGHGIGRTLLEETIEWARQNGVLARLELSVQVRNERAVALYEKLGFEIEGIQRRGARTDEGEWLDLYYMGRLIDKS